MVQSGAAASSNQATAHYIHLVEAARRVGLKRKTLQNWIAKGRLTCASGLIRVNGRPMIDWPRFEQSFVERS